MADINHLKQMVDVAGDMTETARMLSERDRDYYDGYQWTAAETGELQRRKQPVITDNRIRRKIDALVGIEQRGRVDPQALPRNPDDEQAADVATKALVYADDITRLDVKRSQFAYNLGIEGYGGVEVCVAEKRGQIDPEVMMLRWEEIVYDPHSRQADFSDAAYIGVQKWMSLDQAVAWARKYNAEMPEEELRAMLEAGMYNSTVGQTYEDRPFATSTHRWGDRRQRRVKVAYLYYLEGTDWRLGVFCGGGVLYDEVSPYIDEDGKPCCGIILQSCYVDRENRRSGIVRDMIPLQDEINKRRSKLLHMLNTRQTMGQSGAVTDVAEMKRQMSLPDGHVQYEQDPHSNVPGFQVIPQMDQIQGQFALLEQTVATMDNLGPDSTLVGQVQGDKSGRAIMAQQQAGMAQLAPFYDAIRDWNLRVYRAIWCRIRQFWTEPRWIRVTDEPGKMQFLGLNMPMVDAYGQVQVDNRVGELDVDITIDMMPDHASLQHEEFQALMELASTGMVQFPPRLIIKASTLRNKADLLEDLEGSEEEQAAAAQLQQQMQAMQMQMAQIEMAIAETKAADQAASARKKDAEAAKIESEIGRPDAPQPIDMRPAFDAQIKREQIASAERQQQRALTVDMIKHADTMAMQARRDAADRHVKAAQAEKLRRPEPTPAAGA